MTACTRLLTVLTTLLLIVSCQSAEQPGTYIQGHRGARGLMPENTIAGFIKALDYHVSTLELDVVISGDSQVVVSHEPWMSAEICSLPEGGEISNDRSRLLNLYEMSYAQITQYDCGKREHPRFLEQEKRPAVKPLLSEVFQAVDAEIAERQGLYVGYNIELKSDPRGDSLYHPNPATFTRLVYETINKHMNWKRVSIQSFDVRILQEWHRQYPQVPLVYLVEGEGNIAAHMEKLGFTPRIYSPDYTQLTAQQVLQLQEQGMKVVPWTVNEVEDMQRLAAWGVDAIITDYPDRALAAGINLLAR